ncbi:MAG: sugar transferase [Bacteroidales bacterium]|nr:sugar transferase [Bacteroidales bacterium]
MFRKPLYFLFYDIVLVTGCFLFWVWLKPASVRIYLPNYVMPFLAFLSIWLLSSVFFQKYRSLFHKGLKGSSWAILSANGIALSVSVILIYGIRMEYFSRQIVFGTVLFASVAELFVAFLFYQVTHAAEEVESTFQSPRVVTYLLKNEKKVTGELPEIHKPLEEKIRKNLIENCGYEVYNILSENIDPFHPKTLILSTTTQFNVDKHPEGYFENIINIKNINDIRFINKFFRAINDKLPFGGIFIGCGETKQLRKKRILAKYPLIINYIAYIVDFIFSRVLPKFHVTKPIYYFFTNGLNRALSKAEILGRLYYCGFELVREIYAADKYFFIVHKVDCPHKSPHSNYGLFIRLRRIGKNNKKITVYKLRTMHPYSEYIQDLVYSRHGSADGDKALNDYRITSLGRIFRRLWLDELPMLLNIIKREIKIVGVRPLSEAKFKMYPKYMQEKRTRCKPGLIPPFYVHLPNSFKELVASEEKYLDEYFKHPLKTDIKYFFSALYNIIVKKARSS